MFKFVVLAALVAVAMAEPGFLAAPAIPIASSYSSSYGYRAPVVKTYAAAPAQIYAAQPAALTYTSGANLYNAAPYPYISSGYIH